MMSTQSTIYWNEIISQQYNFDRVNIEVAYLRTITQPQLLNFYKVIIYFSLHISTCKIYCYFRDIKINIFSNIKKKKKLVIEKLKKLTSLFIQNLIFEKNYSICITSCNNI